MPRLLAPLAGLLALACSAREVETPPPAATTPTALTAPARPASPPTAGLAFQRIDPSGQTEFAGKGEVVDLKHLTPEQALQMAAAHGGPPPGAPAGAQLAIAGTVNLAPGLATSVKPGSILYISVRQDAAAGVKGKLLAARRVPVTGAEMFPLAYQMTAADLMSPGADVSGALRVEARVDQDGDAMSRTPGDLAGRTPDVVKSGPDKVDVILSEKI